LKKQIIFLFLVLFLTQFLFAQKIAVMDFNPLGYFDQREIQILSERFRSEIVNTQKFEVMERNELVELDRELVLQLSGGFDPNVVAEAGKKTGAKYVVLGSIGMIGNRYTIDVKMVNCETSRIENSYVEDYKGNIEGLVKVMKTIAYKMAGIKEKKNTWLYISGGVVTVGTAVIVAMIKAQAGPSGLPMPPNPPDAK